MVCFGSHACPSSHSHTPCEAPMWELSTYAPRGALKNKTYSVFNQTVSTVKKSQARISSL